MEQKWKSFNFSSFITYVTSLYMEQKCKSFYFSSFMALCHSDRMGRRHARGEPDIAAGHGRLPVHRRQRCAAQRLETHQSQRGL